MLRAVKTIRVSEGTAGLLGLKPVRSKTPPTTAYLMIGEHCPRDCAFCAQARGAEGRAGVLSRVTWPEYPLASLLPALARASANGLVKRVCVQTVAGRDSLDCLREVLPQLKEAAGVPLSASVYTRHLAELEELYRSGLDRAGIAVDAASPQVYREAKRGDIEATLRFLAAAAQAFPGRVSTHLIAGLGETEAELLRMIQWCTDRGITVGLFAFTPVRGTRMERVSPPEMAAYRRVQAAAELIRQGRARAEHFAYDTVTGMLSGLGLAACELWDALAQGEAFRTTGCPDCNRPYYNERPGQVPYNYPRPLTADELREAMAPVLALAEGSGREGGLSQ